MQIAKEACVAYVSILCKQAKCEITGRKWSIVVQWAVTMDQALARVFTVSPEIRN
jgi:hypothetical protein